MYEKNPIKGNYRELLKHIKINKSSPEDIALDYDILKGDYSVIKDNIDLLPDEVQEALEIIFHKKIKNKDLQFLHKVKRGIEKSQTLQGHIKTILFRLIHLGYSETLPLSRFGLNFSDLERVKIDRKNALPVLVPSEMTDERDPFLQVLNEVREELMQNSEKREN
jgi:hypothetical protein